MQFLEEPVPAWMTDAACRDMDTDVFFPTREEGSNWKPARDVCQGCPVRRECLAYAIRWKIKDGIWGGMGPKGRRKYARRMALFGS